MTVLDEHWMQGQRNELKNSETNKSQAQIMEQPKSSWKVDENGNLIRYDSIYSWSSHNNFDNLTPIEPDSIMQSFKSRFFTKFSHVKNQGFEDIFAEDSLFNRQFFNDDFFENDFGRDFMDIDSIKQRMLERQRKFLKKYKSEFNEPKG